MRASELKSDFKSEKSQSSKSINDQQPSKASKSKYSVEQSFNRMAHDDTSNIDSIDGRFNQEEDTES